MATAAVEHIVGRIAADVEFLVSEKLVGRPDADAILAKLPQRGAASSGGTESIASRVAAMNVSAPSSSSSMAAAAAAAPRARPVPPPPARPPQPPAQPAKKRVKALWAYEVLGSTQHRSYICVNSPLIHPSSLRPRET
jgi:hypothetical protein